ncbi:hypothetical protein ACFQWC_21280 [Rossellomorea sp. GCM10028870]|uniref:hypothetical protein n=1 Tax=Rossellomorea sp. GCM10028870 TaxID=3273426 RepID=UPI00361D2993
MRIGKKRKSAGFLMETAGLSSISAGFFVKTAGFFLIAAGFFIKSVGSFRSYLILLGNGLIFIKEDQIYS